MLNQHFLVYSFIIKSIFIFLHYLTSLNRDISFPFIMIHHHDKPHHVNILHIMLHNFMTNNLISFSFALTKTLTQCLTTNNHYNTHTIYNEVFSCFRRNRFPWKIYLCSCSKCWMGCNFLVVCFLFVFPY